MLVKTVDILMLLKSGHSPGGQTILSETTNSTSSSLTGLYTVTERNTGSDVPAAPIPTILRLKVPA